MRKFRGRFIQDGSGATAIEYGLIAGLMALCIGLAMGSVSSGFSGSMAAIGDALAR